MVIGIDSFRFTYFKDRISSVPKKLGPFDSTTTCYILYAQFVNSGCLYSLCWHHTLHIIS